MAKRIRILDGSQMLTEGQFAALELVADRTAAEGGAVQVSLREFQGVIGVTVEAMRRTMRKLENLGLVLVEACFDDDGGQRANRYTLTEKGGAVVAEVRERRKKEAESANEA